MSSPPSEETNDGIGLPSLGPRTPSGPSAPPEGEPRPRGARRGDIVGDRYVVDGQIGRGGMGRVLQVRHAALGKLFALKIPQRRQVATPKLRERFNREAKLASSLQHENICSVIDFGEDPRFGLFMVMELLEGVRLDHKIARDGRLPLKAAYDIVHQAAEALHYVHGCGIIHGDIKSDNIFLLRTKDKRRTVKLLDFGLAHPDTIGGLEHIEGTPEYLAPERIHKHPPTAQSDIYALGILFWELLVGGRPFNGSQQDVFTKQLTESLRAPSTLVDYALDQRADLIIARATAKQAEERHPDVASFLYELRTLGQMLGFDSGRRRIEGSRASTAASSRKRPPSDPVAAAAAEVFEASPVPLASVDQDGLVRVANRAFHAFVGRANESGIFRLSDTMLLEVHGSLMADLATCATSGSTMKRRISIPDRKGKIVDAVVILTPPRAEPRRRETPRITAGDVYLAIHPLAARRA